MPLKSLNIILPYRKRVMRARNRWLSARQKIRIDSSVELSLSARVLSGAPGSIEIEPDTLIAFKTLIYSRDHASGRVLPVRIGRRCFVGGGSVIMPGVTVGDGCIIGAGSVVRDSIPAGSVAAGNPARVLRSGIEVGTNGRMPTADERARAMYWDD